MAKVFTIGEAAKAAGVSVETIRFYERKALIRQPPQPVSGGLRDYGGDTLERLRFIAGAKRLGFSLAEIAELLALRSAPNAGCRAVQARARAKRADVQTKLEGLLRIRDVLDNLIAACPGAGGIEDCTILDALDGAGGAGRENHARSAV